jgi:outer membrane protein assembly factor BamB
MLLTLFLFLALGAGDNATAWSSFRNGGASRTEARHLPRVWSPKKGISWNIDLPGYGQSAPVVWNQQVFVTAIEGENKEKNLVLAFDTKTGKQLWRHETNSSQPSEAVYTVSRAAPTPVVDTNSLYVFFESGDLMALSHAGKPRWQRSLTKEYGPFQNGHGIGTSPAQTKDLLLLLIEDRGGSYLMAVDKKTGKNRWRVTRKARMSWTSPVIAGGSIKEQVIVSSGGEVQGYDVMTGELLWTLDGLSGNNIPSATVVGDRVYIGASRSRRATESTATLPSNCCLRLVEKEGKPGYEVLWRADGVACDYASPVVHQGYVYYINPAGVLFCVDAETGKQCYAERIDGACWATPVAAGDILYCFGKNGMTTLVKIGPTFEKVASNALWNRDNPPKTNLNFLPKANANGKPSPPIQDDYLDPIVYGVAAVEGAIFVRTGTQLYAIRLR